MSRSVRFAGSAFSLPPASATFNSLAIPREGVYPSRLWCYDARVMIYSKQQLWERFKKYYCEFPTLGVALDLSRTNVSDEFFAKMELRMQKAFADMAALEAGAIANPDEGRMVGHYGLRNPGLAPNQDIRRAIEETLAEIKAFAADVQVRPYVWSSLNQARQRKPEMACSKPSGPMKKLGFLLGNTLWQSQANPVNWITTRLRTIGFGLSRCGIGSAGEPANYRL
jgi:hypothetical protein